MIQIDTLNNGDILGIYKNSFLGFFTKIAQFLGGYKKTYGITHVAVSRKINNIWYVQEMDGLHNVLRPISQYLKENIKIEVYRADNIIVTDETLDRYMSIPIKYNRIDLLKIGFQLITRFKNNGSEDDDNMVCSGYAESIISDSGWIRPSWLSKMPSPCQLCESLRLIGKM